MQEGRGRLSNDEIERLIREAEEYATQDGLVKKRLESLNNLENYVRVYFFSPSPKPKLAPST